MPIADKPVLIPERRVAARYGVTWRTLMRWDTRAELNFPPVIKIGGRCFRELAALEKWDLENAKRAAAAAKNQSAKSRQRKAA
jgi:hypothetical protein